MKIKGLSKKDSISRIIQKNIWSYVAELQELVRIPSVSTDRKAINACSRVLAGYMKKAGISTEIYPLAKGNPIVLGQLQSRNNSKGLLVYGHYDAHPVGKLADWEYSPFKAELSGEKLYGRGAADNKGNFFSWVKAVEILNHLHIDIPLNLTFLFDGEEEIGSPNLGAFVRSNRPLLEKCGSKVVFEPRQDYLGRPFINLGWKGILLLELAIKRKKEVHSSYAPIVENPIDELIGSLSSLKKEGKILIYGFYDNVQQPSKIDLDLISKITINKKAMMSTLGTNAFGEEIKDSEILSKLLLEPSLTFVGIQGGYVGSPRTVIPSVAKTIVEFRLVPNQSSSDILSKLQAHFSRLSYHDIEVKPHFSSEPSRTSFNEPIVKTAIKSIGQVFKKPPLIYPNLQGTSPDWIFTSELGIPSIGMGVGYHHLCHSPNEYISIEQFSNGIELAASLILNLTASRS